MKDTKVRNLVVIAVCLIVLFPVIRYIDNLPTAEEVRRQEERQQEEERERKEEEVRLKEKEEEEKKEAEEKVKNEERKRIWEEKRAKEERISELADKVYTFFSGCKWEVVNVDEDGKIHLECYSSSDYWGDTEVDFNITQAKFETDKDDNKLYVSLGNDFIAVCPSGDHTIFLQVLEKFKQVVKADILEE